MMGTEVEQQWIDEAACLLAVVEGDFSEAGLRHCARLNLADEGTALHFVGDLSAFHHFQVARALVPSILRCVAFAAPAGLNIGSARSIP